MIEIRCHFGLRVENKCESFLIAENTSTTDEVKITIVKNGEEEASFRVNGETMIKAIRKCIEP